MPDHDELTTYAAGRWPVVVRSLVLLGAPLRHAEHLAVEAVGRFLDRCDEDDWVDLDVVLAAEVVETWDADRTPWWRRPEQRTDVALAPTRVPDACADLDRLPAGERARVVVAAVVGLTSDQLDDALGPGPTVPSARVAALASVAAEVPVTEPRLDDAREWSTIRRQAGRGRAVAGLVAGLAAVVVLLPLGARVVDGAPASAPAPASDPESDPASGARSAVPPPTSRVVEPPGDGGVTGRRRPDLAAVAWYDGRRVHLPDRTVRVPRVVALALSDGGVVATDARGRVLHVRDLGTTEVIGRTDPATPAAADGAVAAWIDRDSGTLAVRSLLGGERRTRLPSPARVVAVDGRRVYVEAAGVPYVVERPLRVSADVPAGLVDAAGGATLERIDGLRLRVVTAAGDRFEVVGIDGELSPDARHLLVRDVTSSSTTSREVVDVRTDAPVVLPLPERSTVVDAAFDAQGRVTFVLERPGSSPYLGDGDPAPRDEYPGHDLVVCDLEVPLCRTGARAPAPQAVPLLAR